MGKSTLFNRLTRSRDALVADFPGLTRDRKYGNGVLGGKTYTVIDTGGISGDEEGIDVAMAEQSLQAIDEADIVLFMVDGRSGLNVADEAIANHLRVNQKKTWLVVNKTDGSRNTRPWPTSGSSASASRAPSPPPRTQCHRPDRGSARALPRA